MDTSESQPGGSVTQSQTPKEVRFISVDLFIFLWVPIFMKIFYYYFRRYFIWLFWYLLHVYHVYRKYKLVDNMNL